MPDFNTDALSKIAGGSQLSIATARSEMINVIFATGYPTHNGSYPNPSITNATQKTPYGTAPNEITYAFDCDQLWELEYNVGGFTNKMHFLVPETVTNNAVQIFHGGHEGGAMVEHQSWIQSLLNSGFRVLVCSMACAGPNASPYDSGNPSAVSRHNVMFANWVGHDTGSNPPYQNSVAAPYVPIIAPYRPFFEPSIAGMNWVQANFNNTDDFYIIGFSGGAWLLRLLQAMDLRIKRGYAICGGVPPEIIKSQGYGSRDAEQHGVGGPELYDQVHGLDFMICALSDSRKLCEYHNDNDQEFPVTDYTQNDYESFLQGYGDFDGVIDYTGSTHGITNWTWDSIMQKITDQQS